MYSLRSYLAEYNGVRFCTRYILLCSLVPLLLSLLGTNYDIE